jgi:hypothetical protein
LSYATDPTSRAFPIREEADLLSRTQISPPDDSAEVLITAVDGLGLDPSISGDRTEEVTPPSENEYSIGLLIRFGELRYHTAGDAGGVDKKVFLLAFLELSVNWRGRVEVDFAIATSRS